MRSIITCLLFVAASLSIHAQQKVIYDAHAEKRAVSAFHAIRVSQGITLIMEQGGEEALAISADKKEYGDAVKTEVVNGELRIYIEQSLNKWWQQLKKKGIDVKAYVSFKTLDKLDASSGAEVKINGSLSGQKLGISLSSGAVIKGEMKLTQLKIDQSSGARSDLSGQVQNLQVTASSGAHFRGYQLIVQESEADASSGGKIEITVNKQLEVSASSGGAITYRGEGRISSVKTGSGGKVRRAG
jgi:hypothetical protein